MNINLRNILAFILVMLIVLSALPTGAEGTLYYEYKSDSVSGKTTISITGSSTSRVIVYIYKKGDSPDNFSYLNPPVALWYYNRSDDLSKQAPIELGAALSSGEYTITIANADEKNSYNFRHLNALAVKEVLMKINSAAEEADAQKVFEALSDGRDELLLDAEDIDNYGELVSKMIVGREVESFAFSDELNVFINEAEVIYGIITAPDGEVLDALIANSNVFGINDEYKTKYIDNLNENARVFAESKLRTETGYLTESFAEYFKDISALAYVAKAAKWQDIKDAVTDTYKDVINIDTTDIDNLDSIFKKMINYTYSSIDDIKTNFEKAKDEPANTTSSKANNGGGGGTPAIGGSASVPAVSTETVSFSDIGGGHWAYEAVINLVKKQILSGYPDNSFRPLNNITRAEFVKIIVSAFGITGECELPFNDVSPDAWYTPYIEAAYSNGIISGVGGGRFAPDESISRQDACVIINRIMNNKGTGILSFLDNEEISDYAKEAISALFEAGIIKGVGYNRFAPNDFIDRQSAAVLINNSIN